MKKFGLDVQKKNTQKWGGSDGVNGGGIQYHQITNTNKFKTINVPQRNVNTDNPYDYHIQK